MIRFTSTFLFWPFITQGNGCKGILFKDIVNSRGREKIGREKAETITVKTICGSSPSVALNTPSPNLIYTRLRCIKTFLSYSTPTTAKYLHVCVWKRETDRKIKKKKKQSHWNALCTLPRPCSKRLIDTLLLIKSILTYILMTQNPLSLCEKAQVMWYY